MALPIETGSGRDSGGAEVMRTYFTKLELFGQPRSTLASWSGTKVATFFIALGLPTPSINVEQRPCGADTLPLGDLFANIKW